jgi:PAS domain-containing protein
MYRGTAVSGAERTSSRWLVSIIDITEQKKADEALKEAHATLEQPFRERTADLIALNRELQAEIETRRRAEQDLFKMEERFDRVFETASDFLFVRDRELRYTHQWRSRRALRGDTARFDGFHRSRPVRSRDRRSFQRQRHESLERRSG